MYYTAHQKWANANITPKKQKAYCPIKEGAKLASWCARAQLYVAAINAILKGRDKTKITREVNELNAKLKTPKDVEFTTAYFLSGRLQITPANKTVLVPSKTKLGYITCCICSRDYKWSRVSRALIHICSVEHNKKVKAIRSPPEVQGNASCVHIFACSTNVCHMHVVANMMRGVRTASDGNAVLERIQNYVAQNVAAASLPFTAGSVACDCVSAALCTITGKL